MTRSPTLAVIGSRRALAAIRPSQSLDSAGSVLCVVILEEVEVKGRKWYRPTSEPNVSVLL